MEIPDEVLHTIRREYKEPDQRIVEVMLKEIDCSDLSEKEAVKVMAAVLDLAKGNSIKVADYVKAANQDYRDVIYWAYYYEDDPFRLLRELLEDLMASGVFSDDEVLQSKRASAGSDYRAEMLKICEILKRNEKGITIQQFEMIKRIAKRLKIEPSELEGLKMKNN